MDRKQKLELVKSKLLDHPRARQWINHLEKNSPDELEAALKNESTVQSLISQALNLETEAESMEESMEGSMGNEQAQMESMRQLSNPPE